MLLTVSVQDGGAETPQLRQCDVDHSGGTGGVEWVHGGRHLDVDDDLDLTSTDWGPHESSASRTHWPDGFSSAIRAT